MQESLHSCLAKQQAFRQSHEPPVLPPLLDIEDNPIPAGQPHRACSKTSLLDPEEEEQATLEELKPGTKTVIPESLDAELLQACFDGLRAGQHPEQKDRGQR